MNTVRIRQFGPLPTRDARMSGRDTVLDDKFRITPNSCILAEPAPEVGPGDMGVRTPTGGQPFEGVPDYSVDWRIRTAFCESENLAR